MTSFVRSSILSLASTFVCLFLACLSTRAILNWHVLVRVANLLRDLFIVLLVCSVVCVHVCARVLMFGAFGDWLLDCLAAC